VSDGAPAVVRAGPLTAILHGADLRWVRWDGVEVVRRLGFAARDPGWGTVAAVAADVTLEARDDDFTVRVDARHVGAALDLRWTGTITADASGTLTYAVRWTAAGPFAYNRIGLVALLPPATVAGRAYVIDGPAGRAHGAFPHAIAPQPFNGKHYVGLAPPMTTLAIDLPLGTAQLTFTGEPFELEDQRNWADDSFKAYGTPLSVPLPRHAVGGDAVEQSVALRVAPAAGRPRRAGAMPARAPAPTLRVGGRTGAAVGALGTAVAAATASATVSPLAPAFLRADLDAAAPDWPAPLSAFLQACGALAHDGEVGLRNATPAGLGALLADAPDRLARVVLAGTTDDPTDPACCADPALSALARTKAISLLGGTHRWFAELHRWLPEPGGWDGMAYVASPQVHDRDTPSIAENVAGLRATIGAARALYPDLPIAVRLLLDPAGDDARLASPWGGAWLAAAAGELLAGGAAHVSALDADALTGAPEAAAAFVALTALEGLPLLERSAPPGGIGALAFERDGRATVLLANAGGRDVALTLHGPDGREHHVPVAAASWAEHPLS
jgi:hypothetical protein